jgi:hypothetical protein
MPHGLACGRIPVSELRGWLLTGNPGHGMAALNQELCLKIGAERGTRGKRWIKGLSADIVRKETTLKTNTQMGTNY